MLIGKKKNVQYGLIRPSQAPKPLNKKPPIFSEDDAAEEGSIAKEISRQAANKRTDAKTAELHAAALAQDPSVFDYDAVFEDLQEKRSQPKQAEKIERKSRYIEGLLDKAKDRQREQDILYERRLAKERQAEDHLFGDKDRFVTSAYKKKLQEDQKWLAEERIRDVIEAREDVTKRGHMGDFYRNLMHNNVAFGTAQPRDPTSARAPHMEAPASQPPDMPSEGSRAVSSAAGTLDMACPEVPPQLSQLEADSAVHGASMFAGGEAAAFSEAGKPEEPQAQRKSSAVEGHDPAGLSVPAREASSVPSAAGEAGVRQDPPPSTASQPGEAVAERLDSRAEELPDRETKAASARERFLARKRKAAGDSSPR